MFNGFNSRAIVFSADSTGLTIVTPVQREFFPLDSRFFNRLLGFIISRSQLFTFFATIRSIYRGLVGGYFCILHVKGIGFKVFMSYVQRALYFFLGYNHLTKYRLLESLIVRPVKGYLLFYTFKNDVFGRSVYHVRHLRFPDPYRGKGIRYRYQIMRFKPGKQR